MQLNQKGFSAKLFLIISVGGIALAEIIAMILVYFVKDWSYLTQVLLDTTVLTLTILPLLYSLSYKPLIMHIRQRERSESIIQIRLHLMEYANSHSIDELLQFTLDEIESLTSSSIGFFHFLEVDQKTISLQAWSTNTLKNMCKADGKGSHYDIEKAGVWADAVRQSQAIIHNNYAALQNRRGMPEGHAVVIREIVVPVLRNRIVVAILGVGNKPQPYTAEDVELVSTIADFAWDVVEHMRADNALHQSEEKFRTLVDWTYDWEKWVSPDGMIIYTSPSCERISGYPTEDFIADPTLLVRLVHPDDRQLYEEHKKITHDSMAGPTQIEYRLISRDGSEHWIEHVCRPVYGANDRYLGRRVSSRDITLRKQAEMKIAEQAQTEARLTQSIQNIRTDIARDLHDSLGQNISYIRMNLDHLSEAEWNDAQIVKIQIQNLVKVADESYELIRAMLAFLDLGKSTDPLDLFSRYAEQITRRSSIQIDITSQRKAKQLSPYQIRQLFYIFREALSNIEKYAKASEVTSEFLWNEEALKLIITDNGIGFDLNDIQSKEHYGLKFMGERAELMKGNLAIKSTPGYGTTIAVVVPYEDKGSAQPR